MAAVTAFVQGFGGFGLGVVAMSLFAFTRADLERAAAGITIACVPLPGALFHGWAGTGERTVGGRSVRGEPGEIRHDANQRGADPRVGFPTGSRQRGRSDIKKIPGRSIDPQKRPGPASPSALSLPGNPDSQRWPWYPPRSTTPRIAVQTRGPNKSTGISEQKLASRDLQRASGGHGRVSDAPSEGSEGTRPFPPFLSLGGCPPENGPFYAFPPERTKCASLPAGPPGLGINPRPLRSPTREPGASDAAS